MNTKHATLTGAVLLASLAWNAPAAADVPKQRGYGECVDAAREELNDFVTLPTYYLHDGDVEKRYFINGTAWVDGDRRQMKVACATSWSGRRLVDVHIDEGRYTPFRGRMNVRVADH